MLAEARVKPYSREPPGHWARPGLGRDHRQTGQESVTRSARSSDRVGRMWYEMCLTGMLLSAFMLANHVDLDARSGMGAGLMCPAHVNSHGRRGERWKRAECESIHVVNTCIVTRLV